MQFNKNELKKVFRFAGVYAIRFFSGIFDIFPIKKKRILFYSFNGKSFSCNPREVFSYLYDHNRKDYEFIWSFRNPEDHTDELNDDVKVVRFRSLKHYYYMKTSRVVVYNVHEEGEVARRKGQKYIQTWHASNGYKNLKPADNLLDQKINRLHHKNYSYVCSGCESMTERRVRDKFLFKGRIIKGTPRMDRIINCSQSDARREICQELQIPDNAKLVLFAPTWREDRSVSNYGLEYDKLRQYLTDKFGGDWYVLVRFHPNVKQDKQWNYGEFVVNVTDYADMQKLMCASDIMISDYSSCVWDFSFTGRPCFLFLYNFEELGGNKILEIPIEEWGFPYCFTMEELKDRINDFVSSTYAARIEKHHELMGSYEDGHATERVAKLIESIVKSK